MESPYATDPTGPDTYVALRNDRMKKEFALGDLITFPLSELETIWLFYQTIIEFFTSCVEMHCRKSGVVFIEQHH